MLSVLLQPHTRLDFRGRYCNMFPAGDDHISVVYEDGETNVYKRDAIYREYKNHNLRVMEHKKFASVSTGFEKDNRDTIRRATFVSAARKLPKGKQRSRMQLEKVIRKVVNDNPGIKPPSTGSLYDWIRKFDDHGRKIDPFTATIETKRKQDSRIAPAINNLIDEYVDQYLSIGLPSVMEVYRKFLVAYRELYLEDRTNKPFKSTFYNRIGQICPIESTLKRHGRQQAKAQSRTALEAMRANTILEQVQVDAIHLNIPVYDNDENFLGNPIIHFCIDVFSRAILGFSIELDSESSAGVTECLKNAVRIKDRESEHPYTKNDWAMYGRPLEVGSDGGSAYISEMVTNLLAMLTISRQVNESYTPWHKGVVERFNRTLRDRFASQFFSYIGRKGDERNIRALERKGERVTLANFEKLLTIFIVDDYNQHPHTALLGKTPSRVWSEEAEITGPMEPHNLQHAMKLKGNFRTAKCDATNGLRVLNIYYNSSELHDEYLRVTRGDPKKPFHADILFNPMDISEISVVTDNGLISVPACRSDYPFYEGMTHKEHKSKRARALKEAHDHFLSSHSHSPISNRINEYVSLESKCSAKKSRTPKMPIDSANQAIGVADFESRKTSDSTNTRLRFNQEDDSRNEYESDDDFTDQEIVSPIEIYERLKRVNSAENSEAIDE